MYIKYLSLAGAENHCLQPIRQRTHKLSDLVRVSKMNSSARKSLKVIVGLWLKALTTLGCIFAAPSLHCAIASLHQLYGVSKSKLICIVKDFLAMGEHSKKPFSLHLNMILKHKALNL